ncbi:TonB-dependent receptor [Perlabentimonas gracilis]|uniref:TonB-dependent receptor n=1 Tax=Perlabentimonas gracilis TaxID=2715279 RepID=UPI00140DBC73|nr:TonB-dependent receptor [Perlabentimonas gracilis]NHB69538.1 TonB-dependent receptor [Perlabentimonas gracilis]
MEREVFSTKRKALMLNLDNTKYGTIAEIGGGQEVARSFFQAGGASGTIAKTISAYDKTFSDHLYNEGDSGRYVSLNRLEKMLQAEYNDLLQVLGEKRSSDLKFFSFADTVETLNYQKSNQGHGWMGVKFEHSKLGEPNEVVIHVRLLENDGLLQQYTLGTLGVNLIFACFHYHDRPNVFLQSLLDNLDTDRVEITMARMTGPDLCYVDNRLLCVQLVKNEMTPAVMFDRHGEVHQPADFLYKKNALVLRGRFRPITYVGFDILKTSYALFKEDKNFSPHNTLQICEITLNNLLEEGEIDERDFLNRVDLLNGMGQNVLVSNFQEFYKVVDYFNRFKILNLRVILGVPTFRRVMEKKYYTCLRGGILEAMGRMFPDNTRFYIYPALDRETGKILLVDDVELEPDVKHIFDYLVDNRKIRNLRQAKTKWLHITPNEVLRLMHSNDKRWETMVPRYVSKTIREKKIFGYK